MYDEDCEKRIAAQENLLFGGRVEHGRDGYHVGTDLGVSGGDYSAYTLYEKGKDQPWLEVRVTVIEGRLQCAYVRIKDGEHDKTVELDEAEVVVDYNKDGEVCGIEFLSWHTFNEYFNKLGCDDLLNEVVRQTGIVVD